MRRFHEHWDMARVARFLRQQAGRMVEEMAKVLERMPPKAQQEEGQ